MFNLSVPARLPLFSSQCRVSNGRFPHIHPDEARYTTMCNENALRQVSCRTPGLMDHLNDVGDLKLDAVKTLEPVSPADLPRFVPVVDREFFNDDGRLLKHDVIGISLKDIFQTLPTFSQGCYGVKNLHPIENLLDKPLFQKKKVILLSTGRDSLIESFWTDYRLHGYIEQIHKMGFANVTALNFSLWLGGCAVGQYYNMKRSLLTFAEFQRAGTSSIPHLYWFTERQLEYWATWLQKNPTVELVTINCQLYRQDESYIVRDGILYLLKAVSPNLHFLLEGPKQKLLQELREVSSSIHVTQKWLSASARNYRGIDFDGHGLVPRKTNSQDKRFGLMASSIDAYQEYLNNKFYTAPNPLDQLLSDVFRKAKYKHLKRLEKIAGG